MKRYVFAAFVLIFIYSLFFSVFRINDCDEGYILTSSMRILNGQIPYKDFFLHTPPLTYYAVATAFKLFGQSVITARVLTAITGLFIAVFLYLISRKIMPPGYALIAPLFFMTWGTAQVNIPSFAWFGLLFALASAYFFIFFLERKSVLLLAISGIFCGLSFVSKQNLGLCVFIITAPAAACLSLRYALLFALCSFLPLGSTMLLFYFCGSLSAFIKYVFVIGAKSGVNRMQAFPIPPIKFPQVIMAALYGAMFYFGLVKLKRRGKAFPINIFLILYPVLIVTSIIVERALPFRDKMLDYVKSASVHGFYNFLVISSLAVAVIAALSIKKSDGGENYRHKQALYISVLALAYLWAGLFISRDMIHHIYSIPPMFVLGAMVFSIAGRKASGGNRAQNNFIRLYAVILPVIFIIVSGFAVNINNEVFRDSPHEVPLYMMRSTVGLERARGILTDRRSAMEVRGVVDYIDANTTKNDTIFYTFFPDSEIYFLADRMPASFYHFIYVDTVKSGDQKVILEDLERNRPKIIYMPFERYAIRERLCRESDNAQTYSVEKFIYDNYDFAVRFGRLAVLKLSR